MSAESDLDPRVRERETRDSFWQAKVSTIIEAAVETARGMAEAGHDQRDEARAERDQALAALRELREAGAALYAPASKAENRGEASVGISVAWLAALDLALPLLSNQEKP